MSSAIDEATIAARQPVLVDLALQGGGSHGAFTWGVLDRLLEEPWIRIEAISGTSAGAMNAAVLADGWSMGGADGARAALEAYWRRVSRAAAFSPLQRSPLERMMGRWTLDASPVYLAMDLMSRVFSPYDLNPTGFNPLRQVLTESIDFERLVTSPIKLFITATNVHTGRGRIFATAKSRRRCFWPPLRAFPRCSGLSRSTVSPIGTAVSPGIPPSRLLSGRATRMIPSWSRSIRGSAGTQAHFSRHQFLGAGLAQLRLRPASGNNFASSQSGVRSAIVRRQNMP